MELYSIAQARFLNYKVAFFTQGLHERTIANFQLNESTLIPRIALIATYHRIIFGASLTYAMHNEKSSRASQTAKTKHKLNLLWDQIAHLIKRSTATDVEWPQSRRDFGHYGSVVLKHKIESVLASPMLV